MKTRYVIMSENDLSTKPFSLGQYTKREKAENEIEKEMRRNAYDASIGYKDLHQRYWIEVIKIK